MKQWVGFRQLPGGGVPRGERLGVHYIIIPLFVVRRMGKVNSWTGSSSVVELSAV